MAIEVYLFTVTKRINSTLQPSGGVPYMCELKDGCSVTAPVLKFNAGLTSNIAVKNYCHIPDFNRYYFVTDWVRDAGLWICKLTVDPLATYKADISTSSYYILRSENNYNNKLFDNMATAIGDPFLKSQTLTSDWTTSLNLGRYVMGVVGKDTAIGATTYYVLTPSEFAAFGAFMFSTIDYLSVSAIDLVPALVKCIVSPLDYIVSCVWFPFIPPTNGTSVIKFGFWESTVSAGILANQAYKEIMRSVSITRHPQWADLGAWTMLPPYTQMSLYISPFGQFTLDTTKLLSDTASIYYYIKVDCISGQAELHVVYTSDEFDAYEVLLGSALVGVTISLAQTYTDVVGLASDAVGALGNAATGNIGGALSNMLAMWTDLIPKTSIRTGSGGFGALTYMPHIDYSFLPIAAPDAGRAGRPCLKNAHPSSGYNLMLHGETQMNGTDEEHKAVKAFLESGFFYE